MAISREVLKALKEIWAARVGAGNVPKDAVATEAIEKVLNLIDRPAGQAVDVAMVIAAIAAFQRLAGISGNEGILTHGLAEAIKRLVLADDNKPMPSTKKKLRERHEDEDDRANWIRYFVDTDSLSSFAGSNTVRKLCEEAWDLWLEHAEFLFVREVEEPGDGVVTVQGGTVSGSGVGKAPVLGPGNFNRPDLVVTLEIAEINSSDALFRAIAAHEFGHIIGIGHLGQAGNLMSVTVIDSVTRPQAADIKAAQRIYGVAPDAPPVPTPPGDFPGPGI